MRKQLLPYWWMSGSSPDTNSQGQQAFLFIGDSIMAGSNNSTGRGPTPTSGTAYMWDNVSSVVEIGANDVVTAGANQGTMIPKMAIDYNAATDKKIVAICRGSSGSNYYPDGDNNNWSSTGTLRASTESAVTSTLAAIGTTKLKAIVVGSLGINDARGVESIANIEAAMDSFYTWLQTTYPNVPILCVQMGRHATQSLDSRLYAVRKKLVDISQANENIHIVGTMASWAGNGLYGADNLHGTQTGNNFMGSSVARWFSLRTSLNKWVRGYISSLYGAITETREDLLNTLFTNQTANGNYFKLEHLSIGKTSLQNDTAIDLSFLGFLFSSGGTWVANSHIATNGTSNHYTPAINPSVTNGRAINNDFVMGVKIKNNLTASGVVAALLGGGAAANNALRIAQSTTPAILYQANSAAIQSDTSPDVYFQNSTVYSTFRNGNTEGLIKDKTVVASVSTTPTTPSGLVTLGASNIVSLGSRLNAEYEWCFMSKYSDLDYDSLVDDLNTLVNNW